jgi:hypothetical protein
MEELAYLQGRNCRKHRVCTHPSRTRSMQHWFGHILTAAGSSGAVRWRSRIFQGHAAGAMGVAV